MAAHRFRFTLFAVAVGLTLALGRPGDAAPKVGAPHMAILQELHHTRMLLLSADHDYAGRRIRAVEQINHAIHALTPARQRGNLKNGQPGRARAGAMAKRKREPQAMSDRQVHQAIQQLLVIRNQLGSMGGDPHARKAMSHVHHAITDLHTALKIR